ncbi:hypothetical protein SAMN05216419_100657 [Nitrosomonas cryotolerans]|uniref:Uncharacterized protein n=1 Tax=Nitrosomonas cryotolerans ATCC 49181 TaxID=1131553 RepID=A0A1N6IZF1_9PROT|nr:hypothetical protein [Nitrosomonas cryotolerans]SFP54696.1 hypothetical protein SAMN05216419_100657 [Nitrosomonas cryotolerans]SIO37385.1 hypothetical protein SAMN02743940_2194 [Nitrosomonas cryotolerans ATCC 49181]
MASINRKFQSPFYRYDFDDLEGRFETRYGVWEDFILTYLDSEWSEWCQLTTKNGEVPEISTEWNLGGFILDCMLEDIKALYESKFDGCIGVYAVERLRDIFYRDCHQIVYPSGQREDLLFIHFLVIERSHNTKSGSVSAANRSLYINQNNLSRCAYCRRISNIREVAYWDWLPEWVKQYPRNTMHVFCPACFGFHFPIPGK